MRWQQKNAVQTGPGRFPGIVGNARNYGNDLKFHKSHQILSQTKRNINKLCLRKISRYKTVRTKFSVDSGFSNELYGKKQKRRKSTENFLNYKAPNVNGVSEKLLKSNQFFIYVPFWL